MLCVFCRLTVFGVVNGCIRSTVGRGDAGMCVGS